MIGRVKNTEIKFKDGTKVGLKDFFHDHYPAFAAFAGKFVSGQSVCEDIVQDVFISFWEKRGHFHNLIAAKAFFYTSIKNACLDNLKHQQVKQKFYELKKTDPVLAGSYLDEIIKIEAHSLVYQEINKLPEMERKVMLLALSEKTNEEIANTLNIAINTVRTHKARAYRVLREKLGELALFFVFFKNYHS